MAPTMKRRSSKTKKSNENVKTDRSKCISNNNQKPCTQDDFSLYNNENDNIIKPKTAREELGKEELLFFKFLLYFRLFILAVTVHAHSTNCEQLTKSHKVDGILCSFQPYMILLEFAIAPAFGHFADVCGSQLALLVTCCMVFLTSVCTCVSSYMNLTIFMYLSHIPAVFTYTYLGSQIVISKESSETRRIVALSFVGFVYSCGTFVAKWSIPMLIASYGAEASILLEISSSAFSIILTCVIHCGTNQKEPNQERSKGSIGCVSKKKIALLFCVKGLLYLSNFAYSSSLKGIALKTGYFSYESFVAYINYGTFGLPLFVQGFGHYLFSRIMDDGKMLIVCFGSSAVLYFSLVHVVSLVSFVSVTVALLALITMTNILMVTSLTKSVPVRNVGAILGWNFALQAVFRFCFSYVIVDFVDFNIFENVSYCGMSVNVFLFFCFLPLIMFGAIRL